MHSTRMAEAEVALFDSMLARFGITRDRYRPLEDGVLQGIYTEVALILLRGKVARSAHPKWAHAMCLLDEHQLLRMARQVDDPHPFVPLLQLIIRLRGIGDSAELRRAQTHLQEIGQALLDAQGCSKVTPIDMVNRPLPVADAIMQAFRGS